MRYLFRLDMDVQQIWKWHIIHNEVALFLVHFEEEGMVGDDVAVVEMLYVCEVALQEEDVLAVQTDALHCEQLTAVF